jgi:large subunit ribosomal protein L16
MGLQSTDRGWLTARQIEAARVALTRSVKRGGRVWVRVFPDKPVSKKPAETRMGKGKGSPEYWVAVVRPGRMLFEIEGIEARLARSALALASAKLPLATRVVERGQMSYAG